MHHLFDQFYHFSPIYRRTLFVTFISFGIVSFTGITVAILGKGVSHSDLSIPVGNTGMSVLAAESEANDVRFMINVPSTFQETASFENGLTVRNDLTVTGKLVLGEETQIEADELNLGDGSILAGNIIYSIEAGSGLSITEGQNPTITNTGVVSLGGKTGALTLDEGIGIDIDGVKITNSDPGSSQKIFKTIVIGAESFSAGSNTDSLEFVAGSGVTVTADTTNKKITIASSGGGGGSVTSLDGLSGVLTISNTTGSGTTITIDDASTTGKGIASFNSTNFSVSSGVVNLVQNIGTSASPAFAGLTLSGLTTNGGLLYTNGSGALSQLGTGTSGYVLTSNGSGSVPSWQALTSSQWTTSGSHIYYNTGNVGIGTTVPRELLHLTNTGDAVLYLESDTDNSGGESHNSYLLLSQDGGTTTSQIGLVGNAGDAPSGSSYTGTLSNALTFLTTSSNSPLQLGTNSTVRLTLDTSGNIGIGTTGPTDKLEVNGNIRSSDGTFVAQIRGDSGGPRITFGDTSDVSSLFSIGAYNSVNNIDTKGRNLRIFSTSDTTGLTYLSSSGNIGIGTTSPIGLLHLNGSNIGKALVMLNETGSNDILTASASGTTKFSINNSGQVYLSDGSAPSTTTNMLYSVSGNLYWAGTQINGLTSSQWTTSGSNIYYNTGNVGIGTTVGDAKLHVVNNDATTNSLSVLGVLTHSTSGTAANNIGGVLQFKLENAAGSIVEAADIGAVLTDVTNGSEKGAFVIRTATNNSLTEQFRIGNTGNVGIGTTNTSNAKLDIQGSDSTDLLARVWNTNGTGTTTFRLANSSNNGSRIQFTDNNYFVGTIIGDRTNGIRFRTGSTAGAESSLGDRMTILPNGNIGVGTTSSSSRLDILSTGTNTDVQRWIAADGSRLARLTETSGGAGWFEIDNATGVAQALFRGDGGASYLLSGNFGIGTSTPLSLFNVDGSSIGKSLAIFNQTGDQHVLSASVAGSTKFVINNNGNVGIGTSSPGSLLSVSGYAASSTNTLARITASSYENWSVELFRVETIGGPNALMYFNGDGTLYVSGTVQASSFKATNIRRSVITNTTWSANDVVVYNASGDTYGTTTTANDNRVFGVAVSSAGSGWTSDIQYFGAVTVNVTGAVAVGDILTTSTTAGRAMANNSAPRSARLGKALSSAAGPGNGTVTVLLNPGDGGFDGGAIANSVGIGTTSPTTLLNLRDTRGGNASLIVDQRGSNSPDILTASASGVTKLVLANNGNLGIGTTNVSNPLTVGSDNSNGNGAHVTTGGTWTNGSSRDFKENITSVDEKEILSKISQLSMNTWNYKNEDDSIKHIGPIAEDFYTLFGLGGSNKYVSTIDPAGVALVGVKALTQEVESLKTQLLTASVSADFLSLETLSHTIDWNQATQSGDLTVLGRTTLSDVGITGKLVSGLLSINGAKGEISVVGDLKLQANGFGNIDLFAGKVLIENNGDIKTKGTVTAKKVIIDTTEVAAASAGKVILPAGEKQIEVTTKALTDTSLLFVTPERPVSIGSKKKDSDTFTISIADEQSSDLPINWWVVDTTAQ